MNALNKLSTAQVAEEAKYQLGEIGKAKRISRKLEAEFQPVLMALVKLQKFTT
ncbi:hypothetical protein [Holospora elegans]|nr:hypothetical protein [Holospora elegans]